MMPILGGMILLLLAALLFFTPGVNAGIGKAESAEIRFHRDRLVREAGTKLDGDKIRKAYRKLALRLNQHLYGKKSALEMQMRMLNLAKDALVKGERLSSDDDFQTPTSDAEPVGEGQQLSPGKRLSEDIFKSIKGWQAEAVEKNIVLDDPEEDFEGNTQSLFDDALEDILSDPNHEINRNRIWANVDAQNSTLGEENRRVIERRMSLAFQACGLNDVYLNGAGQSVFVENDGSITSSSSNSDVIMGGRSSNDVVRGLEEIAGVQWDGRSYNCAASQQGDEEGDETSDGSSGIKRSRPCSPCGKSIADDFEIKSRLFAFARELRYSDLNLANIDENSEEYMVKIEQLRQSDEYLAKKDPHCLERKHKVYEGIANSFHDFNFGKVIAKSYPLDPCALLGLEQFVKEKQATHIGQHQKPNFTNSEAVELDRRVVQGLSGLLGLQKAKYNFGGRSKKQQMLLDKKKETERKRKILDRRAEREKKAGYNNYGKKKRKTREEAEQSRREKIAKEKMGVKGAVIPRETTDAEKRAKILHKRHWTCRSKIRKEKRDKLKAEGKSGTSTIPDTDTDSLLVEALRELEEVAWTGTAFPELHEMGSRAIADLSNTLQLQRILVDENLETLRNLDPIHDPPTEPIFPHLSFPGLALRPYMTYEIGLIAEWGDEFYLREEKRKQFEEEAKKNKEKRASEKSQYGDDNDGSFGNEKNEEDEKKKEDGEENLDYDPVKIALGYLDLVPYCDMQTQVVGSFLQAGFWFWKALQSLDENCENDYWVNELLIEELQPAPLKVKHQAVVYALKKAVLEMLDTSQNLANHMISPSIRFLVSRTNLRIRNSLLLEYGTVEDVPKLIENYLNYKQLQKFQPLWHPPAIMIGDVLFADVLTARLQEAFMVYVGALDPIIAPISQKELVFMKYETDLLQMSYDFEASRYAAMEVALNTLVLEGGVDDPLLSATSDMSDSTVNSGANSTSTGYIGIRSGGYELRSKSKDEEVNSDVPGIASSPLLEGGNAGGEKKEQKRRKIVKHTDISHHTAYSEALFAKIEESMRPRFLESYFDSNGYFHVDDGHVNQNRLDKEKQRRAENHRTDVTGEEATDEGHFDEEIKKTTDPADRIGSKASDSKTSSDSSPTALRRKFSKHRLTGSFLEDGNTFTSINGLEFDQETGHIHLLGSQNNLDEEPLIDAEDIATLLTTITPGEPAYSLIDPISAFHVFQKITTNLKNLVRAKKTKVEKTLSFLAYFLQQIAAQVEVSTIAPFRSRPSRLGIDANKVEIGEPWEVPRVWLECSKVQYSQSMSFDGRLRYLVDNNVEVQINGGERIEPHDVENWSLPKLKKEIRRFEKLHWDSEDEWSIKIPRFDYGVVVSKEELVDVMRKLMAKYPDEFVEDEKEAFHPVKKFARRMTHVYKFKLKHWPLFRRYEEMCKLKALSSILDSMRGQIAADYKGAEQKAARYADQHAEKAWRNWEDVVVETRLQLLQSEMGITDLDPGKCWDGGVYTFKNCCNGLEWSKYGISGLEPKNASKGGGKGSVGDGQTTCFDKDFTYKRCCPDPEHKGIPRSMVRGVAVQLAGMSNKDPDPHGLTNKLEEFFRTPDKMHALRKVVLLLYEGEDPEAVKARMQSQFERVHLQTEFDVGLLRSKLGIVNDVSGVSGVDTTGGAQEPSPALATPKEIFERNRNAVIDIEDLLPALSSSKKIYSGVQLGPEMHPVRFIKAPENMDRVSFGKIMKTKSTFKTTHKQNLITLQLEDLAFHHQYASGAALVEDGSNVQQSCSQEWRQQRTSEIESNIFPGDLIRVVNTQGSEQGLFQELIVTAGGAPGTPLRRLLGLNLLQKVTGGGGADADLATGSIKYYDISKEWDVYSKTTPNCTDEELDYKVWPRCVHQNKYIKGQGIFLNLASFGINKGCFQDDCSHSDHFSVESAGLCAEVCRMVGACKFWSVTIGVEFTCWLKSTSETLVEKAGANAADTTCHPAVEESMVKKKRIGPTLYEQLRGKSLRFPRATDVLALYGHLTEEEIEQRPANGLQRIALARFHTTG